MSIASIGGGTKLCIRLIRAGAQPYLVLCDVMLMWALTFASAAGVALPLFLVMRWANRPRAGKDMALACSLVVFVVIFTATAFANWSAMTVDVSRGEFE